jgi:hypothetical protein
MADEQFIPFQIFRFILSVWKSKGGSVENEEISLKKPIVMYSIIWFISIKEKRKNGLGLVAISVVASRLETHSSPSFSSSMDLSGVQELAAGYRIHKKFSWMLWSHRVRRVQK